MTHRKIDFVWLAIIALCVSLHFWFPRIDSGPLHNSYSAHAEGKKAFYLLLRQKGDFVARNTTPLRVACQNLPFDATFCLLGPARTPTESEWDDVLPWVAEGGNLIIAARDGEELSIEQVGVVVKPLTNDRKAVPSENEGDNDGDSDEEQANAERSAKHVAAEVTTQLVTNSELVWESSARIETTDGQPIANDWTVLLETENGPQSVSQNYGDGNITVIASDFVFSNESLASGDNSVLAFRLLTTNDSADTIVVDESLNVTGTPKVVGLLLDPLIRPVSVQLLIGLVVFAWHGSRRFGPVQPVSVSLQQNIVDHTDAVGIHCYRSGNGAQAIRSYLKPLIAELRLRRFRERKNRVLVPISRRLGRSEESVERSLKEAHAAAREKSVDKRTAARLIHQLAEIRWAATDRTGPSEPKYSDRL